MKVLHTIALFGVVTMLCLNSEAAPAPGAAISPVVSNPWFLQGTLTAAANPLYFGFFVSISGNTIVTTGNGAVYVYVRPGGKWGNMMQTAMLTASDGSFLFSAAISGNTIVAGAGSANGSVGAAYVFVEPAGGWTDMTETGTLTASDGVAGNGLGFSVAIAGNTIVAGASQNNSVGISYPIGPGAAYVFMKPSGGWSSMTQTAKLTASDGVSGDDLGYSVAVLGDTVAAGAPDATIGGNAIEGAVYVFQRSGSTWKNATETAKLTASDGTTISIVGFDLGISGNTIAASAIDQVYIFTRPASGWTTGTQTAELKDPSAFTFILNSVAICNKYVLTGAPMSVNHSIVDLYVEPSTGWTNAGPTNRFRVPAGSSGDFGFSVGIQGTTLVIGAPNGGTASNLYVYGPA